jgi:uncharacterized membrane protein (DUF2068 family)
VTILAVIYVAAAVSEVCLATASAWDKGFEDRIPGEAPWINMICVVARIAFAFIYGLIAVGLWRLRKWARGVLVVLMTSGITIAVVMVALTRLVPELGLWTPPLWGVILLLVCSAFVIYYLMRADVKHAFGIQ